MSDRIEISGIEVPCVVGVLESEQRRTQRVVVDLVLGVDLDDAASGELSATVDYAGVTEATRFLGEHGQWRLIESYAAAIARLVLAPPPPAARQASVERVTVCIRKPEIMPGAVPGISIERGIEWCDLGTRMLPEKTWVDTLVETARSGAYRAHVEPESTWAVPPGAALLVLAGAVEGEGRRYERGARLARGEVRRLKALGALPSTLLVVSQPPLSPVP